MTVPAGDRRTLAAVKRLGYPVTAVSTSRTANATTTSTTRAIPPALEAARPRGRKLADPPLPRALARLQQYLFSADIPPAGDIDESVSLFSAPGEGREL